MMPMFKHFRILMKGGYSLKNDKHSRQEIEKKIAKQIACVFKRKTITTPFYTEVSTKKLGQGKLLSGKKQ